MPPATDFFNSLLGGKLFQSVAPGPVWTPLNPGRSGQAR